MPVIDLRGKQLPDDEPQTRVVAAALRCVAKWGINKTTLEDVAREAGLSRATVYRVAPGGKDSLFELVAAAELNRFFLALDAAVRDLDDLEDVLVAGVNTAARQLGEHAALKFMIEHEPDQILPWFAFTNLDMILANVRVFAAPYVERWLGDDAGHSAEWLARIVLSYVCTPSPEFNLADKESARRLVRTFVLPGLRTLRNTQTSSISSTA
jgi:AcrR family transcriptional regulator